MACCCLAVKPSDCVLIRATPYKDRLACVLFGRAVGQRTFAVDTRTIEVCSTRKLLCIITYDGRLSEFWFGGCGFEPAPFTIPVAF